MVVFDSLYGTQIFGFDMIIPGNHVVFATTVWQKLLT
jgi:formate-dependent phosphoribosylglycinamide formyltransferase (GAR transformylase)